MGFAMLPDTPRVGVWMLKKTGDLIVVTESNFLDCTVWYKSRQKRGRRIMSAILSYHFERLGDL